MIEAEISRLRELLSKPSQIILIPHKNPDGDAMGSCLAWYHFLKRTGHEVNVIAPNEFPRFLKWMPGSDEVVIAEREHRRTRDLIEKSETIFALDFNSPGRAGDLGQLLEPAFENRTVIMIDHHQQPEDFADIMFSDTSISSTCELSYSILRWLSGEERLGRDISTCLYTGMVTDTGSFKYRSTTGATHEAAAYLIGEGIDNTRIHQQLFDTFTRGRLQLLGRALGHMQFFYDYKTAFSYLTQEDLDEYGFEKGDTEGFVNYGLSLDGVVFAVIFIENRDEGIIKISFRSKGAFDVNAFAREHFQGGGHLNAAGGRSTQNMEETLRKFESLLPGYATQLLSE